jgi:hypothetical protein
MKSPCESSSNPRVRHCCRVQPSAAFAAFTAVLFAVFAASHPAFRGTAVFVPTHDFVRPKEESPNPGHGHHEFGNAETYLLTGQALGSGMLQLLQPATTPKPGQ